MKKLNYNTEGDTNPLEIVSLFKTRNNLKSSFISSSVVYLGLIQEMQDDVKRWNNAAAKAKENDPQSFKVKNYLLYAHKIDCQIKSVIRFHDQVQEIISKYENELWLKEQMENMLLLQSAAYKQGRNIDVLGSASSILTGNKLESFGNG